MGRPDSISFADLRRKVERSRRRRETIPRGVCGQLPTAEGHNAALVLCRVSPPRCGHGKGKGYVMFESGQTIRGYFDHAPRKR
jgi:hypothetical protein